MIIYPSSIYSKEEILGICKDEILYGDNIVEEVDGYTTYTSVQCPDSIWKELEDEFGSLLTVDEAYLGCFLIERIRLKRDCIEYESEFRLLSNLFTCRIYTFTNETVYDNVVQLGWKVER